MGFLLRVELWVLYHERILHTYSTTMRLKEPSIERKLKVLSQTHGQYKCTMLHTYEKNMSPIQLALSSGNPFVRYKS